VTTALRTSRRRWILCASLGLAVHPLAPGVRHPHRGAPASAARTFDFGAFGDTRFSADEQARFPNLVEDMNAAGLAFSVHDGNIGADPDACSDRAYQESRHLFEPLRRPARLHAGRQRMAGLPDRGDGPRSGAWPRSARRSFASDRSLGATTMRLERQSAAYPENARWRHGGVTFATLHVVGSHDDLGAAEFAPRRGRRCAGWSRRSTGARKDGSAGNRPRLAGPTPSSSRTSPPTTD